MAAGLNEGLGRNLVVGSRLAFPIEVQYGILQELRNERGID